MNPKIREALETLGEVPECLQHNIERFVKDPVGSIVLKVQADAIETFVESVRAAHGDKEQDPRIDKVRKLQDQVRKSIPEKDEEDWVRVPRAELEKVKEMFEVCNKKLNSCGVRFVEAENQIDTLAKLLVVEKAST
jgi:hypothetical protein